MIPIVLGVLALIFIVQGMVSRNAPNINPNNINGISAAPITGINQKVSYIEKTNGFDREKSDAIKRKLNDINGIKDINAIVRGNTALVGYRTDDNLPNRAVIKESITSRIRNMDNTITNVIISDSEDFFNEIKTLAGRIATNPTASDLTNDFNNLIENIEKGLSPNGNKLNNNNRVNTIINPTPDTTIKNNRTDTDKANLRKQIDEILNKTERTY